MIRHLRHDGVRALRHHACEEPAPVEDRQVGRDHDLVGVEGAVISVDAVRRPQTDPPDALAGGDDRAVCLGLCRQLVQEGQWIDLELPGEDRPATSPPWHRQLVVPHHRQPSAEGGVVLGAGTGRAGPVEGARVASLVVDRMAMTELLEPRLTFLVRAHIPCGDLGAVATGDRGQPRPLQEADLGRAAAGRARTDLAGLEHSHGAACPRQQQRGDQTCQAGADDGDVDVPCDLGDAGDGWVAVLPERREGHLDVVPG